MKYRKKANVGTWDTGNFLSLNVVDTSGIHSIIESSHT